MTREEFETRFRLVEHVTGERTRTYHALAVTGAVVMVHFLEESPSEQARLLSLIEALPPDARRRVTEITEVDGTPVVVSKFLMDFSSFPAWLEKLAGAPATPEAAHEPEPRREPGEFTRMFERRGAPSDAPAIEPGAAPQEPAEPAKAPGEFTRMFRTPVPPAQSADPPSRPPRPPGSKPPPSPPEAEPRAEEAGEFTRLFRAPLGSAGDAPKPAPVQPPPRAAEPPAAPPPESAPVSGDSHLPPGWPRGAPRPASEPPAPPPPRPAPPPPPKPGGMAAPGDFTRVFSPSPPERPPARESTPYHPGGGQRTDSDDYLRRLGARPSAPADTPRGPDAQTPREAPRRPLEPPPLATPARSGPGEYTRVISAHSLPSAPPPKPPPELRPPAPKRSNLPLFIGIGVVVLLALVLIAVVALVAR